MEYILVALTMITVFLTGICFRFNAVINAQHDIILDLTHELQDLKQTLKEQDIY